MRVFSELSHLTCSNRCSKQSSLRNQHSRAISMGSTRTVISLSLKGNPNDYGMTVGVRGHHPIDSANDNIPSSTLRRRGSARPAGDQQVAPHRATGRLTARVRAEDAEKEQHPFVAIVFKKSPQSQIHRDLQRLLAGLKSTKERAQHWHFPDDKLMVA